MIRMNRKLEDVLLDMHHSVHEKWKKSNEQIFILYYRGQMDILDEIRKLNKLHQFDLGNEPKPEKTLIDPTDPNVFICKMNRVE